MRGHIHKRVRRNTAGKETVRWYVVVDVGVDSDGRRQQKWHGGFSPAGRPRFSGRRSSARCTRADMLRPIGSP